jgi:hypothetical protein
MSRSIGKATLPRVALWLLVSIPGAAGAQSTAVVRRPRPTAATATAAAAGAIAGVHVDSAALRRLAGTAAGHLGLATPAAGVATTTTTPAATQPPPPPQPPQQRPAAKTISRARLESVLGGGAAAKISVVRAAGEVATLPPTRDSVTIRPGEIVLRKTSDTALRVAARTTVTHGATGHPLPPGPGDTAHPSPTLVPAPAARPHDATYAVPYRWLMVDSAGVERVLVPYFVLDGGGLTYDVASRTYRGTALVGVEDTLHPGEGPVALPRAVSLQLTTTSSGGRVAPRQLAIGHTSLDYDSVRIESADSTQVRIRTGADQLGVVVPIPVRAITVGLVPQQPSLEGLGLATTEIAVTLPRGMGRTDTANVIFSSTRAPVRPGHVQVTGDAPATVRLRSGAPGPDSIRAFLDGVKVGETVVTFEPPWSFTGATLAGLLLGGLARFVGAKRRKRVRALGWDLLKGAPFGVIAAAASAVGLDLLQLRIDDPGTWVAVMLTAAIGAWTGSRLLERVAPGDAPTTPARPATASPH